MHKALRFLGLAALLSLSSPAHAAPGTPQYESSEPSKGEMVHQSFDSVSVTFNELLDAATAELSVSACGEDVDDENVTVTGFTVEVGIVDNPVGTYTLSYSVSGADDTPAERENPSEDSFPFTYHSKDCGDDDENGGHDGHGDDNKDENHSGKHSDKKKHGRHEKDHGGTAGNHDASGHLADSSHDDDHGASGSHSDDHEDDGHNDGNHKSRHKDSKGKHDPKHSNGHGDSGDKHETGEGAGSNKDGGSGSKTSARVSPWINLSVVLLLPALVGLVGGRRLRQLNLRPSG